MKKMRWIIIGAVISCFAGVVVAWAADNLNSESWESAATDDLGQGVIEAEYTGTGWEEAAIFGVASSDTSGVTFGVLGQSRSTYGRGVMGEATTTSDGDAIGVYGLSHGINLGTGVKGRATAPTGITYGVHGESFSISGSGVRGTAYATSGTTYGVYGSSTSTSGRGVYGFADAFSGTNFGVHGESRSTSGKGVYGHASATSGATYGVYGRSDSTHWVEVFTVMPQIPPGPTMAYWGGARVQPEWGSLATLERSPGTPMG
jgi:hypothetical protein